MCILTMKSVTNALRARSVLEGKGVPAEVVNLDPKLTKKGCLYGIRFPCGNTSDVRRILTERDVPFGELMGNPGGNK